MNQCFPPQNTFEQCILKFLQQFNFAFGNTKDSAGGFLCTPDTAIPVFVRYSFSTSGASQQTSIITDAWNLDGTAYSGDKTLLIACTGGGSSGNPLALVEYFICDDGVQKIVSICGTACDTLTVSYLLLDRTTSTEPVDWDAVTAGDCGSSGAGCCCKTWVKDLCYTVTAPEGTVYMYRENNAFPDNNGTYDIWTWSPDAPVINPLFLPATALVHGPDPIRRFGDGTFDSSYTTLYTFIILDPSGLPNLLQTTDMSDPANPVRVGSNVPLYTAGGGAPLYTSSIYVDPTSNLLYSTVIVVFTCYIAQVDPITGYAPTAVPYDVVGGAVNDVLGFDQNGNIFIFRGNTCYTCGTIASFGPFASSWTFSDTNEVVLAFMGYFGNGYYGVVTYNNVIYQNRIMDLATGTIIETVENEQRGLFYAPADTPAVITEFTRVYNVDCDGVLTTEDRDFFTGDIIIIPEGATIGACP